MRERRGTGDRDLALGYDMPEARWRLLGHICKDEKDAWDELMGAVNFCSKLGEGHPKSAVVRQATTYPKDQKSIDEARAVQARRAAAWEPRRHVRQAFAGLADFVVVRDWRVVED